MGCSTSLDFNLKSSLISDVLTLVGIDSIPNRQSNVRKNHLFMKEKCDNDKFSKAKSNFNRNKEMEIVQETREELMRAERWKLIYPSYNVSLYSKYFDNEETSEYNSLLRNEIGKHLGKIMIVKK